MFGHPKGYTGTDLVGGAAAKRDDGFTCARDGLGDRLRALPGRNARGGAPERHRRAVITKAAKKHHRHVSRLPGSQEVGCRTTGRASRSPNERFRNFYKWTQWIFRGCSTSRRARVLYFDARLRSNMLRRRSHVLAETERGFTTQSTSRPEIRSQERRRWLRQWM